MAYLTRGYRQDVKKVVNGAIFEAQYDRWVAEGGEELLKPYTDGVFALLFGRVTFVEKTIKSFIGYFGYFSSPLPTAAIL